MIQLEESHCSIISRWTAQETHLPQRACSLSPRRRLLFFPKAALYFVTNHLVHCILLLLPFINRWMLISTSTTIALCSQSNFLFSHQSPRYCNPLLLPYISQWIIQHKRSSNQLVQQILFHRFTSTPRFFFFFPLSTTIPSPPAKTHDHITVITVRLFSPSCHTPQSLHCPPQLSIPVTLTLTSSADHHGSQRFLKVRCLARSHRLLI